MTRFLVTGGAGFIGSAFVRAAINEGHEVLIVDKMTYAANIKNLRPVADSDLLDVAEFDICEQDKLLSVLKVFKPDSILNFAAESHVDRSIENPMAFIQTNIVGTFSLLEASRHYIRDATAPDNFRFLHVSTDEVFGSLELQQQNIFCESTPYDPRSPYSASKASSDHMVRAWYHTYNFPAMITNCSNNYGPYHHPEKLIPKTITNALQGLKLPIYGTGQNIRDWLYVDDHISALMSVVKRGTVGSTYVIGGMQEMSNIDLVNTICELLDEEIPIVGKTYSSLVTFVEDRPGHDVRYAINPRKIMTELDWMPNISLREGLRSTVRWYIDNQEWWKSYK